MKNSRCAGLAAVVFAGMSILAAAALAADVDIRHHDLDVRLDPETHRLSGFDRIRFVAADRAAYSFYLGLPLQVTRAELDGHRVELERIEIDYDSVDNARGGGGEPGASTEDERAEAHPENRAMYRLPPVERGEHIIGIEYEGVVHDTLKVPEGSRSGIPSETTGLIDSEGIYLSGAQSGWYPDAADVYARFSIRVTTPAGIESVTEGKRAAVVRGERETTTEWEVNYPTQHVTLMAGPYVLRERDVDGVSLMAYFFPSEEGLIDTYLDASGDYIETYNKLIGPYPFSKFAVVENFFPTGYGMPSFTLLGRRIVRMPFIVRTSLGHEVVHNWWGNCVNPDVEKGNWCEGLTTYYADYRYEAQKGDSAAARYRRDIAVDYATNVSEATDIPLSQFRSRTDAAEGVIGYGKCLMVFHMLERHTGTDRFYRTMRRFYQQYRFEEADWEDIESAFEEATGEPLDGFFDQWVRRTGAPRLSLEEVTLEEPSEEDGEYNLRVAIGNEGGFLLDHVPVHIDCPSADRRLEVSITRDTVVFDWRLEERPLQISVDPDYDVFRKLSAEEIPVTIDGALSDEGTLVILPSRAAPEKADAYQELADRLAAGEETEVRVDTALTASDLASVAVVVLGDTSENDAYSLLPPPASVSLESGALGVGGRTYADPGHAAFVAFSNALDPSRTVCAILGNGADAVRKAGYKVIYYGKFSYVTFLDGDKQETGVFPPAANPLVYRFDDEGATEGR
jgi:aminopeptidase N